MDVRFDIQPGQKLAKRIELEREGKQEFIDLTEDDLLFITNGSNVENSSMGGQDKPCEYIKDIQPGGSFDLWRKLPSKTQLLAAPEKFYGNPDECKWLGVTVNTLDQKIIPYIKIFANVTPSPVVVLSLAALLA